MLFKDITRVTINDLQSVLWLHACSMTSQVLILLSCDRLRGLGSLAGSLKSRGRRALCRTTSVALAFSASAQALPSCARC